MNFNVLLKALPIFSVLSSIVSNRKENRPLVKHEAILAVEAELDKLISKGHLPADFKHDLGNLVADVVALHPDVPNPPKP